MGLPAQSIKFIIKIKKKHCLKGPVLTLGNQDIYATERDITDWLEAEKVSFKKPSIIRKSTSQEIVKINPQAKNYIHAKTFFEFLDIPESQYYDIDKFDLDKPKIFHDLERPLPSRYHNFFNFILDSGTLEHIFDIKSVMENIVKAVKIGGFVLHLTPAQNFLNHGFYQFCPTFFYDFYTSNGFKIVESYIIETRGKTYRFHYYNQKKDYVGLFLNSRNRLGNCFLVKKTKNLKKIVSPTQYYYRILSENPSQVKKDFNGASFDKFVSVMRKIIPIKYHGVFFIIWMRLKRLLSADKHFDIS